jgi:phasin protein
MMVKPDDFLMKAYRQQIVTGLRLLEALTAESKKLREYQVAAAAEANAAAAAARGRFEAATEVQELWRIQGEFVQASTEKSVAYWRAMYEAAARMQAAAARCAGEPWNAMAAVSATPAPVVAPLDLMEQAFLRWQDTIRRFYATDERKAA